MLILYDFDGTLADSLEAIYRSYNEYAAGHGFRVIREKELDELRDKSLRQVFKEFDIPLYRLPGLVRGVNAIFKKKVPDIEPFPEIPGVLRQLKGLGYAQGIVTSNAPETVSAFLARHNLDFLDPVHSGSSLFGKGTVLQHVLKTHGLNSEEVVYVGDEIRDIEAARENNLRVISVAWGANSRKGLEGAQPDYVIDEPKELLEMVGRLTVRP